MLKQSPWWRSAIVYQIYPWSFQDSNCDGIGDLPGIISWFDYLNDGTSNSLGIDAIWLSPIYPSPMVDFGYDVADYCDVDPRFGTLADFDRLVKEAGRRGIRIIMDLILNHTSDQHPWFQSARSSRTSPERDWCYWADGKSLGRRPSNWNARFGGSSWTRDPSSRQYYLHSFLPSQPDLNWHHPGLRSKMFEAVQFWIDRGVHGFRLDAVNWIGKDVRWPNNPRQFGWRGYTRQQHLYDRDQPLAHQVMRDLRRVVSRYPDVVLIGEASADTPGGPASFCGTGSDELHMVFDFRLLKSPWRADRFRELMTDCDRAAPPGDWPSIVFSYHDQSRHIDRYGVGGDADRRARAAAVLLSTMRGTPFFYMGRKLGCATADCAIVTCAIRTRNGSGFLGWSRSSQDAHAVGWGAAGWFHDRLTVAADFSDCSNGQCPTVFRQSVVALSAVPPAHPIAEIDPRPFARRLCTLRMRSSRCRCVSEKRGASGRIRPPGINRRELFRAPNGLFRTRCPKRGDHPALDLRPAEPTDPRAQGKTRPPTGRGRGRGAEAGTGPSASEWLN